MQVIPLNLTIRNLFFIPFPRVFFIPENLNIIGNGVVLDPAVFKKEIDALKTEAPDCYRKTDYIIQKHI